MNNSLTFEVEMRSTLARIEAKLDMLLKSNPSTPAPSANSDIIFLNTFTTKQHAIIQMLMRDASSEEIAERLRVSTNTAKTHLTMIARKIGVTRRASIISTLSPIMQRITDEAYLEASGGLPKDWDKTYTPANPINALIENKGTSHGH